MDICNLLCNNTKSDVQLSNTIIGLLLELNQITNSNDDRKLIFDNLLQRVDDHKKVFTNMKDNKITNLIEPFKKSLKESTTRVPKNCDFKVKQKNKSCGLCNNTNHTTSTCVTIGQIIDGDVLVDLLQDTCPSKWLNLINVLMCILILWIS